MRVVKLLIEGDLDTGDVQMVGPIGDMRIMHWLLGEARRCVEREATKREAEGAKGKNGKPPLIVVPEIRPGG